MTISSPLKINEKHLASLSAFFNSLTQKSIEEVAYEHSWNMLKHLTSNLSASIMIYMSGHLFCYLLMYFKILGNYANSTMRMIVLTCSPYILLLG